MHRAFTIDRPRSYQVNIQPTNEELEMMQNLVDKFSLPKEGSLITGVVTGITGAPGKREVWIDFGGKAEGVLPEEEFTLRGFGEQIQVGDVLEVWVQPGAGSKDGQADGKSKSNDRQKYSSISFAKAAQMRSWRTLEASFKNKKLVEGIILCKTAGGYVVSLLPYGARAFLPLSQADPQISRSHDILQKYKVQKHQYLIMRMERSWNIIVSRREPMMSNLGSQSSDEEVSEKQTDNQNQSKEYQPIKSKHFQSPRRRRYE